VSGRERRRRRRRRRRKEEGLFKADSERGGPRARPRYPGQEEEEEEEEFKTNTACYTVTQ